MEPLDSWISSTMHRSLLNHDFPIRRFCPARLIEQQVTTHNLEEATGSLNENNELSRWAASEVDEFVDSFINVDRLEDDETKSKDDQFQEDYGIYDPATAMDNVYEDINNIMFTERDLLEMNTGSYDDDIGLGVVPHDQEVPSRVGKDQGMTSHEVEQGLRLVHMLLACAEAMGCRDTKLAESMLNEIWSSASPCGDPLQRVSYFFAIGLKSRISFLHQNVNPNGTSTNTSADYDSSLVTRKEKVEAFKLLHQTTPYLAFGFLAANHVICEASRGKDFLHIIDFGTEHILQWPSLIRSLASRPDGPPKVLRITGLINDLHDLISSELDGSMKAIVDDGISLGIQVEFHLISDPVTPLLLTRENLKLREGEALFFNCIMQLHKYIKENRGSLKATLQAMKKLRPNGLIVVEQDANHNGPFFLGRFLEALHYYSAIFDSLEAGLPRNSPLRMKIEGAHFAEEIRNIAACEGSDRIERHERVDQWRRQLGRAGFQVMGMKCLNQAKMMLSHNGYDGYSLGSEKGCLLLGWKGKSIMLASAWQVNNVSSSSS